VDLRDKIQAGQGGVDNFQMSRGLVLLSKRCEKAQVDSPGPFETDASKAFQ